ncbi:MAG TPA: M48 family peptidase [Mariniphaga anaerophila]|uniref:M48 family peptidase n=1 Tax=Mariniphaga anaerophila TaxID=1484053 RepID=A0A831LRU6_9BACT|nr:M48 family peptidase [Mariniphaga anaerophila]
MPNKVVHFKSIGPVTFFRNRRSKNIKISVKPDKSVLISFPFFVSEKEVLSFLTRNEAWIRQQQDKAVARRKIYEVGEIIQTKLHQVELCSGKTEDVETVGNVVKVYSADFNSEKARIFLEDILNQVYRYEARELLPPRLKELAQWYKFRFNKVSIRNNKRNWGSCSSRNNISLNLQMMKLPDPLIDYILLHELVHTEIKNHSEKFWKKLDEVAGGKARELAKEVKKYSTYTL